MRENLKMFYLPKPQNISESHVENVLLFRLEFRKGFQPFESGKGHQTL